MYLLSLSLYFAALILVGAVLSKKNIDFDSFFYGQRKLGPFLIFFSVTASWFGAATTIATMKEAFHKGFQTIWLLGIPTVVSIVIFILINRKIRQSHFQSLPQFLSRYYGRPVVVCASFLVYLYMVMLASSQFVALGQFISHFVGINYTATVLSGALIVILYSYFGGYLSVVLTDGIQFLLLSTAVVYLLIFFRFGNYQFRIQDFDIFSQREYSILMSLSFVLAWVISPLIWQRIASAKSSRASRNGLLLSVITFSALYAAVIFASIGMRTIGQAGDVAGIVAQILPKGGSILVFLGIGAAIMSTADSALNIGALTLVRDVIKPVTPQNTVIISRMSTFISGLFSVLIALKFDSIIQVLGLASEVMAEGLFILGMAALFFGKRLPWAGFLSLLLGGGFSILVFFNAFGLIINLPEWPYSLPYGLFLSGLGFMTGWLIDRLKRGTQNSD